MNEIESISLLSVTLRRRLHWLEGNFDDMKRLVCESVPDGELRNRALWHLDVSLKVARDGIIGESPSVAMQASLELDLCLSNEHVDGSRPKPTPSSRLQEPE